MKNKSIIVTGGARSGKSHYAEQFAAGLGKQVLFVATAEAGDEEMKKRIVAHRASRPKDWGTLEAPHCVGAEIIKQSGKAEVIIIDCITMLVNNVFNKAADRTADTVDISSAEAGVKTEIEGIINCFKKMDATFIVVTNEVGLGLVPPNPIDRLYRDLLGKANRMLAEQADEVVLLIAGLPLRIKPHG